MPGDTAFVEVRIAGVGGGRFYTPPGLPGLEILDTSGVRQMAIEQSGQVNLPGTYTVPGINLSGTYTASAVLVDGTVDTAFDVTGMTPSTNTDGSIMKAGTIGSPIAFSTAGQRGIALFMENTATSGTFTGMRIRTISGATSNGQNIESILAQASTADDDNATDVTAIRAEVIAKTASEMAGRVAGIAIKVEDARGTDGVSVAPTYGGRVLGIMIEGQISADPTNGYYGIQFDIQTAAASAAQDLDALLSVLNNAGQNLSIAALLATGATLAQYGSASSQMISSGSLTDSSAGAVNCDARVRLNIGGTSYWLPLFNTAA